MNPKLQAIKNRLSLRPPQAESLDILARIAEEVELGKTVDLAAALSKVCGLYPTCADFERDFPSVCFALATGVGKTRLMGAFIAYLYSVKGIRNFFVLAPNLTIYSKLIEDFSNPRSPKYVFRGIAEFAVAAPRVVTGDNYGEARTDSLFGQVPCVINVFNISKINSEVRGGREPRIKRLSEYLGESYFAYLAGLPDLVLLMDESHHYRAGAGMKAISELKPILGLELTATPIDARGTKFKNVVFDYPLARAIADGFVKEPTVATRRGFDPDQYRHDPRELDLLKLEDGIRIHEDTKVALDIFSRDTSNRLVRPFVLVVARDTDHAREVRDLIESDRFFGGAYRGKVMEIHSDQRGEEKEENIQRLLNLERPDNGIEIVVHVNMLKEGWDVTNLYTIIPLRASNSQILTEQTIGRGLRLPYGARTGNEKVDKLTIVAHDRFEAIVQEANKPDSIIHLENIVEIDPANLPEAQEVVTGTPIFDETTREMRNSLAGIADNSSRAQAVIEVEAREAIAAAVQGLVSSVDSIDDLQTPRVRELVLRRLVESIESTPEHLFRERLIEAARASYDEVSREIIESVIPIPRILIEQRGDVSAVFRDFDLDVAGLNYQPVSEEIVRRTLRTNENEYIGQTATGNVARDTPENIIVNELVKFPEVDYDRNSALLYKLAGQAVRRLAAGKTDDDLRNIVLYHKRDIGRFVYAQLQTHLEVTGESFEQVAVRPFDRIIPHNFSKLTAEGIHHFSETISPTSAIPSKLFGGFTKASHSCYKFQSKAEKDLASVLEGDAAVLRWLRPAEGQFDLWWRNSRRYVPDFVVETGGAIYLVEVKAENEADDIEVREKAAAGKAYCQSATDYNLQNRGKRWEYLLLPHTAIAFNTSFKDLLNRSR